ncbi:HU family DNA-binding protein [Streptomyces sp. NPDC094468]|uniref:HU family DNA-binding protein n=1 Tax=Streptomyces sp. NPDC094468 TaxID=3366066 RepID=UPI0038009436
MKKKPVPKKPALKARRTPITERLTTTTLIEVVAADLGRKPADVRDTITATFDAIARANASGQDVAISRFVTFRAYRVPSRTARNPATGELMKVPAHRVIRFRVSDYLADAVRRGDRRVSTRKTRTVKAKATGE